MQSKRGDPADADSGSASRFRPLGQAWRDRVKASAASPPGGASRKPSPPGGTTRDPSPPGDTAREPSPSESETRQRGPARPAPGEPVQAESQESQMDYNATSNAGSGDRDADGRWRDAGPAEAPGASRIPEAGEFGEKAELRRALALLEELIELDPEKLSLYRRRAEYARRLGDEDALLDAYLGWAEVLERRGSWRSAHLLIQQAASLRPGGDRAGEALARLEAQQGAELGVSLPGRTDWSAAEAWRDRAGGGSGLASVIWPELRRALEEVNWLQAAALRMLPGRDEVPDDREAAEREAAEILGRYFVTREEYGRAVDVLAAVVDDGTGRDEEGLDALYLKGLAHLRMDEGDRAEECFRRVARQDEEFRAVAGWFAPGLEETV